MLEQGAEQMVYVGKNVLELGPRDYEAEALATESTVHRETLVSFRKQQID